MRDSPGLVNWATGGDRICNAVPSWEGQGWVCKHYPTGASFLPVRITHPALRAPLRGEDGCLYSGGAMRRVMTLMYSPLRPVGMGAIQAMRSQ